MGTTDLLSLKPLFLRTNAASGLARRTLAALIAIEQGEVASGASHSIQNKLETANES